MADHLNLPENPFETIPSEEENQIKEIADLTLKLLAKRYSAPNPSLRGVHPKSHGCVQATFEVSPDIDKDLLSLVRKRSLKQGLFAQPGRKFDAWVRFSNATTLVKPDVEGGKNDSRGMAVKVLDVKGRVFFEDRGVRSQDFLMINQPSFAFANVIDYLRLNRILLEKNDDPTFFFAPLQVAVPGISDADKARIFKTLKLVQALQAVPVANPLEVQYFGAAPFLFGPDLVMRFSADPCGEKKPQVLPDNPSDNYLREALLETMKGDEDVCFDFKVQVRTKDEAGLEIENACAVWDEQKTPWQKVAKITIPAPQTGLDTEEAKKQCQKTVFSPWQGLYAHQPLGGINRLRRAVYIASAGRRAS